jgi:hypothetical protein
LGIVKNSCAAPAFLNPNEVVTAEADNKLKAIKAFKPVAIDVKAAQRRERVLRSSA